jgi:non-specific serine/threonine protein kinase
LWGLAGALGELGRVALARGEPAEAARLLREALRLQQGWGDRVGVAWCLEALAAVAAGAAPAHAARLLGAAAAARRELGAPPKPYWRPEIAAAEGAARGALGAAAYAAARAAGAALSLEQAAAEALAAPPPPPAAGGGEAAPPGRVSGRRPTGSRVGLRPMSSPGALTPREREVAALLAAGCHTDRQLAARLAIAPGTAGVHVQRILEKLGLRSRWQVVDRASEQGLRAPP